MQAVQQFGQCMDVLLKPLQQLADSAASSSGLDRATQQPAAVELMQRLAMLFQNSSRCPSLVAGRLADVWTLMRRFIEVAAAEELVVEGAVKVMMCDSRLDPLPFLLLLITVFCGERKKTGCQSHSCPAPCGKVSLRSTTWQRVVAGATARAGMYASKVLPPVSSCACLALTWHIR